MKIKTNEKNTYKNIEKACDNFKIIKDNVKNPKFAYLDSWVYKTSKTFKIENTNTINCLYPRFEYGTIIKVDFGINIGSELSNPHFAIVIEKYDSVKSDSITVLPLTSQKRKYNLPLSDLIIEAFTKRLNKSLMDLKDKKNTSNQAEIEKEIQTLQKMIEYYSNYAKNSYACINQITTISKKKILPPKNQFDIIGRAKCNSKTMQIISNEIIKKYTNIKSLN